MTEFLVSFIPIIVRHFIFVILLNLLCQPRTAQVFFFLSFVYNRYCKHTLPLVMKYPVTKWYLSEHVCNQASI